LRTISLEMTSRGGFQTPPLGLICEHFLDSIHNLLGLVYYFLDQILQLRAARGINFHLRLFRPDRQRGIFERFQIG
jgi:hypothetical protein